MGTLALCGIQKKNSEPTSVSVRDVLMRFCFVETCVHVEDLTLVRRYSRLMETSDCERSKGPNLGELTL